MGNKRRLNNLGFTIVELVVVIVILVILATILIPSFTKYFTKSYSDKINDEVDSVIEKSQIIFNDLYANNSHNSDLKKKCIIEGTCSVSQNDTECDMHLNPLAKEIINGSGLNMDNDDPSFVVLGLGKYSKYTDPDDKEYDPKKAYHVYFIIYQKIYKDKSAFIKMDNGTVYRQWPLVDENGNPVSSIDNARGKLRINVEGDDNPVEIELYYVKNGKDNNVASNIIWNVIKDKNVGNLKDIYIP